MEVSWGELPDLTFLIRRSHAGDEQARDRLFGLTYTHLKKVAAHILGGKTAGDAFAAQDLLHDVFVERLCSWRGPVNDRRHYLGAVTEAMKHQLIDRARREKAQRRTPPNGNIGFPEVSARSLSLEEILALERELERMAKFDPRSAEVVRLRYYLGCSWDQTAEAAGESVRVVRGEWEFARTWLREKLGGSSS